MKRLSKLGCGSPGGNFSHPFGLRGNRVCLFGILLYERVCLFRSVVVR